MIIRIITAASIDIISVYFFASRLLCVFKDQKHKININHQAIWLKTRKSCDMDTTLRI